MDHKSSNTIHKQEGALCHQAHSRLQWCKMSLYWMRKSDDTSMRKKLKYLLLRYSSKNKLGSTSQTLTIQAWYWRAKQSNRNRHPWQLVRTRFHTSIWDHPQQRPMRSHLSSFLQAPPQPARVLRMVLTSWVYPNWAMTCRRAITTTLRIVVIILLSDRQRYRNRTRRK